MQINMKKFLVPTDFSHAAGTSVDYAAAMAQFMGAEILLFHAFHIPIPSTEAPVVLISEEDLMNENLTTLKKFAQTLTDKFPGLTVNCLVNSGFAAEEIPKIAMSQKADLIVMGVGGSGMVDEYLFGSTTVGVIRHTKIPVLVIPKNHIFSPPAGIVFSCDYTELRQLSTADLIKNIVKTFNSHLFVLSVEREGDRVSIEKAISGVHIEGAFSEIKHSLHFPYGDDVVSGINEFADQHKAGWVIMIPHEHGFLDRLLNRSLTRKMIFHTHTPLFVIHD
jgi:nucleotide-binding universal stress UspA family protein